MSTTTYKTNRIKKAFASTTTMKEASQFIRCGLEFEFHSLNGNDSEESETDYDALCEASLDASSDASTSDILEYGHDSSYNSLIEALHDNGLSVYDLSDSKFRDKLDNYYMECRSEWESDWRDNNSADYQTSTISESSISNWDSISKYTELGEDNSVRGGEIRTLGPRTIQEFMKVCDVLSNVGNQFDVDVDTSFHIHLSLPGITHSYGHSFQAEMYAYLLSNYKKLPKGVQERLVHDKGALKWAAFQIANSDKHVAIYKHSQGTWEFRLFGNITSKKDMSRCLQLAIGAMRHAYQVQLDHSKSLLGWVNLADVSGILKRFEKQPELIMSEIAKLKLSATTKVIPEVADTELVSGEDSIAA